MIAGSMKVDLSDKLVLLVDDEESLLRGMQAWLRDNQAGYAVFSASDGTQGLKLIKQHRPDLVVADIRMPGLNGLELLLTCRKKYPDTRFILMSAYGTKEIEQRSLSYGAVLFLHKPVDLPNLEQTIINVLGTEPACEPGGFLSGISVPGFAQLLNVERQTLVLNLSKKEGSSGSLYFVDGELVHAVRGDTTGEQAAMELLAWDQADMLIDCGQVPDARTIEKPLSLLLMESMRAKDEKTKAKK
jgi:CheY-like chemotaxis protein